MKSNSDPNSRPAAGWTVGPPAAMAAIVALSNWLVRFPLNDWLTLAAFSYPFSFLITDLANRKLGPEKARRIVYVGFALGVALSLASSTPRIAAASGCAFLFSQLLDVKVFSALLAKNRRWWQVPLVSSSVASLLDTLLFFFVAFSFTGLPWTTWAIGDFAVKTAVALVALIPYRLLTVKTVRPR